VRGVSGLVWIVGSYWVDSYMVAVFGVDGGPLMYTCRCRVGGGLASLHVCSQWI